MTPERVLPTIRVPSAARWPNDSEGADVVCDRLPRGRVAERKAGELDEHHPCAAKRGRSMHATRRHQVEADQQQQQSEAPNIAGRGL